MRVALFAGFLLITVALAAQNNNYKVDPKWKVPTKAAQTSNPTNGSEQAAQRGRELYAAQCAMCHGSDGQGLNNAANFHLPAVQAQSDGVLFWKVTEGNTEKGMPAFKGLSDKDRWSLVTYLRTFKKK